MVLDMNKVQESGCNALGLVFKGQTTTEHFREIIIRHTCVRFNI